MQMRTLFPTSLGVAFLLAGCTPAPPPAPPDTRAADAAAVRQVEADWAQAAASKNFDKFTSFYADDASVFMSDMAVVTGKANIVSAWKTFFADKNASLTWKTASAVVSKSGDIAYTEGSYTLTYTDTKTKKAVSEKGKYVEVYAKQGDGTWKNEADIGNEDAPPAPVKAGQ